MRNSRLSKVIFVRAPLKETNQTNSATWWNCKQMILSYFLKNYLTLVSEPDVALMVGTYKMPNTNVFFFFFMRQYVCSLGFYHTSRDCLSLYIRNNVCTVP